MPTIDELFALVKPFLRIFYVSQINAFKSYNSLPPEFLVDASKGARAHAIHDLSVKNAAREVESVTGIRVTEHDGLFLFTIREKVTVRFKKLDERFRSSNIETQQVFDFQHQYNLPEIPKTMHLEVGYRLNYLETEIEGIYLVWPNGKRIRKVWSIQPGVDNVVKIGRAPAHPTFTLHEEELTKRKIKEE
ncbi:MAG: hypothetical protein ACREQO_02555 [Candidatus Binatia bacterium]|jgi:hypothetical protein